MSINIVADENIPFAKEAFSTIGTVTLVKGRDMTNELLKGLHADALCIRSVTKVDESLLAGTNVRFVGTATIGTDHVDVAHLEAKGVTFASAPGCNANSVSEYVTSAILAISEESGIDLAGKRIGIIGVGNVGSRVEKKARALGLTPILNDPPLAETTGDAKYRPLDEALEAEIVTLHTPLTKEGAHPTYHLCDASFLERAKNCTMLINSSRGKVIDTNALLPVLEKRNIACALDVFENEPNVRDADVKGVAYVTPHIAGYSYDGKVNGTTMVYTALCDAFSITPVWDSSACLPPSHITGILVDNASLSFYDTLRAAVFPLYDIREDDEALSTVIAEGGDVAEGFDRLRRTYRQRREFQHTTVTLTKEDAAVRAALECLGFTVTT